jgi:hypothetical protein
MPASDDFHPPSPTALLPMTALASQWQTLKTPLFPYLKLPVICPQSHLPTQSTNKSHLKADGSAHHVEGNSAEAVLLQEGHEEAEADKDHDVDILKHWKEQKSFLLLFAI